MTPTREVGAGNLFDVQMVPMCRVSFSFRRVARFSRRLRRSRASLASSTTITARTSFSETCNTLYKSIICVPGVFVESQCICVCRHPEFDQ